VLIGPLILKWNFRHPLQDISSFVRGALMVKTHIQTKMKQKTEGLKQEKRTSTMNPVASPRRAGINSKAIK